MFANYLIGLREGLEAALVVSILYAYLQRTDAPGLKRYLWAGVGVAIAVSVIFGAVLTYGPKGLSFEAQEIIGGTLSIFAVGLITAMIFWMARNARNLRRELDGRMEKAVVAGPAAVFVLAAMAVGREGLETALFLWASIRAAGRSTDPLLGASLGLVTAVVLGLLLSKGIARINLGTFFTWTGVLLIFVAAGVLSYGIHDLQEAGVLPGLNSLAFDVSEQVPPGSWYGTVLKGVFNFSPATTWLECLAWIGYVVTVVPLYLRTVRGGETKKTPIATPRTASVAAS